MALKKLEADLSIIAKLGTNPGVDDGLGEEQLKAKFDEAANIIKDYLNNYLILEIAKTVDVESLLSDILDITLSKSDKAANAKATGDAIRGIHAFFEKVIHGGDYILESDSSFAQELSAAATIRIKGGEGIIQGNLFSLNIGGYEDVELEAGTYGLSRNDLVVIRCTKGEAGDLSYDLVALTGANTSGEPVDPEYIKGDINGDADMHDFPLYRIQFIGYDIKGVIPLFEVQKPLENHLKEYITTRSISKTLLASDWSASAPYTQSVEVDGLNDNLRADAYPNWPDDSEAEMALREEVEKVSSCRRSGSTMTFRCLEDKPALDIPIIVEVSV